MKKFIGFLVVILLVAAIAAPRVITLLNTDKDAGESVETLAEISVVSVGGQQVLQGDLSNELKLIGSTEAKESVNVMAEITGKVEKVNVNEGDYVKKGTTLFTIDSSSQEEQITQAQIAVTMAEIGVKNATAAITQAGIAYDLVKINYEMQVDSYEYSAENVSKYETLFEEGVVSESELEQMKLQASSETMNLLEKQLEQAEASVEQAKIGKESAEVSLQQAQVNLDNATEKLQDFTVVASVSGIVSHLTVTENNLISNTQVAMLIEDTDEIIVNINVTEDFVNELSEGDKVKVIIESLDNKELVGIIDKSSDFADEKSLLFPIDVKIENKDHIIKPGMFATVDIVTEESSDILYVPSEAVLLRDGINYVYIQKDDKVERVVVTTGIDTGYFTEILEGVTAENVIITKGLGLIDENSTINLIRSDQ
jgi:RND family efflux transporter MFP subunit